MQRLIVHLLVLALCWLYAASLVALEAQEEYLNHLYQRVKERPLQDGELNLMPDATAGFANTVRCLPEAKKDERRTTSTSRKMEFEGAVLKPLEEVIRGKLVIKLPTFSASGELVLYKLVNGAKQELDRTRTPNSSVSWLELNIGPVDYDMMEGLELQLDLTQENRDFLVQLNAMLVMYTYVGQAMPTNIMGKRSITLSSNQGTGSNNGNTECSKHIVRLQYSQFQWLGDDVTIVSPPSEVNFEYCEGECNFSRDTPLPHQISQDIDTRTRMLEILNQISEHRLTPPPCCIPLSFSTVEIIYILGDIVNLTTLPTVESCGCRS